MSPAYSNLINIILNQLFDIGSLVALFGVPYLIIGASKKKKNFSFDFQGLHGFVDKEDSNIYGWKTTGIVKNRSELPNTISRIFLVVWKDKKKNSFLRNGFGGINIKDINENLVLLPMRFEAREARQLTIEFKFPIKGSSDEKILNEVIEVPREGSGWFLPKHNYQLMFEDIDKNYFDQEGKLVNIDEANLWFTLENTFIYLKEWNVLPFLKHSIAIVFTKFSFVFKKFFWVIGLY